MPLKLILGPANSAKAGVVLGAYRAAAQRQALLVVPTAADAAHYDRELTASGTSLGRALTFPTLIDEIARRSDYQPLKLTPLQSERLLARSIAKYPLASFAASAKSRGFLAAAGRLIAELGAARITAPRLTAALRKWAQEYPGQRQYAEDVAALYSEYSRGVDRTGRVDESQYAWGALDALRDSPAAWGATAVYFYGFDDLTDVQLDTVETLARAAEADVTVSLTYEQDHQALRGRARVAAELTELSSTVEQLEAIDDYYASGSREALHHLERYLFEPAPVQISPGKAVQLMEAGGALAEAEQIAAHVLEALRDGVPPSEIVVVTRSLARSGQLLQRTLGRYGVATDSSHRVPVEHTRLGRAIVSAARLVFSTDRQSITASELGAYLRACSTTPQALDEIDAFEAQIRRGGIESAIQALTHPAARRLRDGASRPAFTLLEELRGAPDVGARIAIAVGELLSGAGADPPAAVVSDASAGNAADARAAAAILTGLGELKELDGATTTAGEELLEVLTQLKVAAASTPSAEPVLIAEPLQIRARRFRRVIVAGLCEGEFPSGVMGDSDPFMNGERRFELASAASLRLPQLEDPLERERYLLYACVSRATEHVSFSYRTSDEEGNIELPSPFLSDIRALFNDELTRTLIRRPLSDVSWNPLLAPTARELRLAQAAADGDDRAEVLSDEPPQTRRLSTSALQHVRHTKVVSAGALVTFARCPVRWLVENQLRPQGLQPDSDPLARGNFMHKLLEGTLASLDGPLTEANLEQAIGALRSLAAEVDHELAPGQDRAIRDAVRDGAVAHLIRFLQASAQPTARWIPEHFEIRFGPGQQLPALELSRDGESVSVSGTIDRVDVDRGNRANAVVRDYKSGGSGKESRKGIRWLQDGEIQVALYMLAAEKLLGVNAVGGLYQPLSDADLRARGTFDSAVDDLAGTFSTDGVDAALLRERLTRVSDLAVQLGTEIKRGQLTPCPPTCSGVGCRYPWICWAQ